MFHVPVGRLLGLACALVLLGGATGNAAVSSTLYAGFDADGNIRLTFADGTMIGTPTPPGTVVPAGTYTIQVNNNGLDDAGGQHFFHLLGPGVNLSVGNNLYATLTWTATFLPGSTYVYQDDQNPTTIREVFGTPGSGAGTVAPPPPQTVPGASSSGSGTSAPTSNNVVGSAIVPFRGTLVGTVGPTGKLTLTITGKPVTSLETGRYRIAVTDRSPKSGFTVQKSHAEANSVTGVPFVGKHSVTLTLKPGQWFFYPTFVGTKTYFLVTK
jgi:hypothetical protein